MALSVILLLSKRALVISVCLSACLSVYLYERGIVVVPGAVCVGQPTHKKISDARTIKKRWLRGLKLRQPTHAKISHEYVIKKTLVEG